MFKKTKPLLAAVAVTLSTLALSNPAFAQAEPKSNQYWWPEQLNLIHFAITLLSPILMAKISTTLRLSKVSISKP